MEIACILTILLLQWNLPFPFLSTIGTDFSKSQSHGFRLVCPELHGQKVKGRVKVTVNLYIYCLSVFCPSCSLFPSPYLIFPAMFARNFIEGMVEVRGILFIVVFSSSLGPMFVTCEQTYSSPVMFQWLKQSPGKHQLS